MKIQGLTRNITYSRVSPNKGDGGGSSGQDWHHHQGDPQHPHNPKDRQSENKECTLEELKHAIEMFQKDAQTHALGLHAEYVQESLGLKIILQDASGTILRKMTPEEFMRLRETHYKDDKLPGKILDLKL